MSLLAPIDIDPELAGLLQERSSSLHVPKAQLVREALDFYLRHITADDILLEARTERLRHEALALKQRANKALGRIRYKGRHCSTCGRRGHDMRTCTEEPAAELGGGAPR